MFKTENYRIRFEKDFPSNLAKSRGRFNTRCEIYKEGEDCCDSMGIAFLHPNDSPDRIVGKKIALAQALEDMDTDKSTRTIIWNDFHKWVESWKQLPDCIGNPTQESIKCNNCLYLDQCINKMWEAGVEK